MCGRFTLKAPRRLGFPGVGNSQLPESTLLPRYNIAPSQEILAIIGSEDERQLSAFVWGLIPSWSSEPKGFINARSETLEVKRSFSESFQRRRCLIPADGFYEWKRKGKSKQPYYFQLQDESQFAFAGIWDRWEKGGASINSCSIITTAPNELLATIHDRMPVMLAPEAQDRWMRDSGPEELMQLLAPFPADAMKSFPVSSKVNHAQVDEPSLVEPVELIEEPENLMLF
ncbi:MAG: SOS response-associated peptidase [Pyrinomonadaceae bacterium]|nr:SOS response-associated peptidase [Pyrinomonadaceae bacterium]